MEEAPLTEATFAKGETVPFEIGVGRRQRVRGQPGGKAEENVHHAKDNLRSPSERASAGRLEVG